METLIFIAIAVVITIIQKKLEKAKEQQNKLPRHQEQRRENGDVDDDTQETNSPPRSLQDLIRQFENAQRQATQGNIEPPTPPVEPKTHRFSEELSLRIIAEVVIEVDVVNLEFLMEEFDVDENTAAEMLMDLQAHRIVGRDMGEGECDVLVHDLEELDNLLSHEKRAEQERKEALRQAQGDTDSEMEELRRKELERQRELNALEERAKSARESAAAFMGNDTASGTEQTPRRAPLVSTKSHADVRKGFIWAKILDEPRFKRRWSAQYR